MTYCSSLIGVSIGVAYAVYDDNYCEDDCDDSVRWGKTCTLKCSHQFLFSVACLAWFGILLGSAVCCLRSCSRRNEGYEPVATAEAPAAPAVVVATPVV